MPRIVTKYPVWSAEYRDGGVHNRIHVNRVWHVATKTDGKGKRNHQSMILPLSIMLPGTVPNNLLRNGVMDCESRHPEGQVLLVGRRGGAVARG